MNDSEIEALLRRYQPVGPPHRLRARMLTPAGSSRLWSWVAAAVLLAAITTSARVASHAELRRLPISAKAFEQRALTVRLVEQLGQDDDARVLVEALLVEYQRDADTREEREAMSGAGVQ